MLNQQQAGLLTVLLLSAASEEERPGVPGEFGVFFCVFCPHLAVGLVYLLEQNLFLPRIWAQPPKTRTSPCLWSRCRLANATKELDSPWFAWCEKINTLDLCKIFGLKHLFYDDKFSVLVPNNWHDFLFLFCCFLVWGSVCWERCDFKNQISTSP